MDGNSCESLQGKVEGKLSHHIEHLLKIIEAMKHA